MLKEDWVLGPVNSFVRMLKKLLKKDDDEILKDIENNDGFYKLYQEIMGLVDKKEINKAEDLIFDYIEENKEYSLVAIEFYSRINRFSDSELKNCDFSREEIYEGILDVSKILGYNLKF